MLINIIAAILNGLCGLYWVWQIHATGEIAYLLLTTLHCAIAWANLMVV